MRNAEEVVIHPQLWPTRGPIWEFWLLLVAMMERSCECAVMIFREQRCCRKVIRRKCPHTGIDGVISACAAITALRQEWLLFRAKPWPTRLGTILRLSV